MNPAHELYIDSNESGFRITDPVKGDLLTPAGHEVIVPTHELAEMILAELMNPKTGQMATQLSATAIDFQADRDGWIKELTGFTQTDFLLRWSDFPEMQEPQEHYWQPVLSAFSQSWQVDIKPTFFLLEKRQDPILQTKISDFLSELSNFKLVAIRELAHLCGSIIFVLAMLDGLLTREQMNEVLFLEENVQMKRWGEDSELLFKQQRIARDIRRIQDYLDAAA